MIPQRVLDDWREWGFSEKHIQVLTRRLIADWLRLRRPKPLRQCSICGLKTNKLIKQKCKKCYDREYGKAYRLKKKKRLT